MEAAAPVLPGGCSWLLGVSRTPGKSLQPDFSRSAIAKLVEIRDT